MSTREYMSYIGKWRPPKSLDLPNPNTRRNPLSAAWRSKLTKAQTALHDRDFDTSSHLVRDVYEVLLCQLLCTLDMDAEARRQNGDPAAYDIAVYMTQLAPGYPDGYVQLTKILLSRNKAMDALDVCERGIKETNADPGLVALQNNIKTQLIDFVQVLPTELISLIFFELETGFLLNVCMLVSKSWHYYLKTFPTLWKSISIDYTVSTRDRRKKLENISSGALFTVHKHVRNLEVFQAKVKWTAMFFKQVKNQAFSKLESLTIDPSCRVKTTGLSTTLVILGRTLRVLRVSTEHELPYLSLQKITRLCPSLTVLVLWDRKSTQDGFMDLPMPASNLLAFEYVSPTCLSSNTLEALVGACPTLQHLAISHCRTSLLPVILERCPNLSYLRVNRPEFQSSDLLLVNSPSDSGSFTVGLTSLIVNCDRLAHICSPMEKHSRTLQEVHILKAYGGGRAPSLHTNMQLTQLRKFCFHNRIIEDHDIGFVDTILTNCPRLETLRIYLCHNSYAQTIIYRLILLTHLREVDISWNGCLPDGVDVYLDHMANLGEACPLQTITLRQGVFTHDDMTRLGEIKTLRKVVLVGVDLSDAETNLPYFCEQLVWVESFWMTGMRNLFTSEILTAFGNMKSLKTLAFKGALSLQERDLLHTLPHGFVHKYPNVHFAYYDPLKGSKGHFSRCAYE